jgi:hypothetical protein
LPGGDHFAPKYLIGNALAGDPAPDQGFSFRYIRDPGDGTGIALALSEIVAGTPGDIWIRPGTYDFNLGAVVAPLVVPAGTTIRGSGLGTTIIRGRDTGNQGVFTLAENCALRDMTLRVNTSDAGSLGSDAVLLVTTPTPGSRVYLANLSIVVNTAAGGQLREGLRVDGGGGFLLCSAGNVTVEAETLTGFVDPTICTRLTNNGVLVFGDHIQLGGDISLRVEPDGGFFGERFLLGGWAHRGILQTGGIVKVAVGGVDGSSSVAGSIAVHISTGEDHLLHSVGLSVASGLAGTVALKLGSPGGFLRKTVVSACGVFGGEIGVDVGGPVAGEEANEITLVDLGVHAGLTGIRVRGGSGGPASERAVWIERCRIDGDGSPVTVGVELGGVAAAEAVRSVWVRDCTIFAAEYGVRSRSILTSPAAQSCRFSSNEINLVPFGVLPAPAAAIHAEGVRHDIDGNRIVSTGTDGACNAIRAHGPNISVRANNVQHTGGQAADLAGGRVTFVGNNIEQLGGVPAPAAVVVRNPAPPTDIGNRCTVSGNAIRCLVTGAPAIVVETSLNTIGDNSVTVVPAAPLTPGISLTAVAPPPPGLPATGSNTCIGNVCEGSGPFPAPPVFVAGAGNDVGHNVGT